jgi:hypothetical protein
MPAKQSRGDREKHATAARAAVNVRSIFDRRRQTIAPLSPANGLQGEKAGEC